MTQERGDYGMPIRFELTCKETGSVIGIVSREWLISESFGTAYIDPDKHCLRQAIGATSSDDPKQELYLGDLIEFNLDKKDVVGEIVWVNFSVWVRLWRNENWLSYLSMSHVLDYFKIKKLGSRYTPEGQGILRKVRLK